MPRLKLIFIILFGWITTLMPAAAQDGDIDWSIEKTEVTKAGPGTPVEGTRWSIGSRRDDILFIIHFDMKTDKTHGVWYGEARAKEKFYGKFQIIDRNNISSPFKTDNTRARGPDANPDGSWKSGPSTAPFQSVIFELDRERIKQLANSQTFVIQYGLYGKSGIDRSIDFPLGSFSARLSDVDKDIQSDGGGFFLKTRADVENTPLNQLPDFVIRSLENDLNFIAFRTERNVEDLRKLSMNDIKALDKAQKEAKEDARLAEIKAKHKAIYDQEPEWMDLNLCPKPDVSFCQNVGKEAYSDDIFGEFVYGPIQGIVWRPEGSIIRIYAGSAEMGIEPEVVRAKAGAYYYIIKTEKGYLDLRGAKGMLVR